MLIRKTKTHPKIPLIGRMCAFKMVGKYPESQLAIMGVLFAADLPMLWADITESTGLHPKACYNYLQHMCVRGRVRKLFSEDRTRYYELTRDARRWMVVGEILDSRPPVW